MKVKFYICDPCEGGCNGGFYSKSEIINYAGENQFLLDWIENAKPGEYLSKYKWDFPLLFCLIDD